MSENILLSIVIPIYKTPEALLMRCLSSVAEMPKSETEVICVLDGKEAVSNTVFENVCNRYPRLRVIQNESNKGVSYSRNVGMRLAKGLYVTFVDADDMINAATYVNAARKGKMAGLDICKFRCDSAGCLSEHGTGEFRYASREEANGRVNFLFAIKLAGMSSVAIVYSRKFLVDHGILFPEDLRHNEDFVFVTKAFQSASNVGLLDEVGYHIVGHPASASRSPAGERRYLDSIKAATRVLDMLDVSQMSAEERGWYLRLVFRESLLPDFRIRRVLTDSGKAEFKRRLVQTLSLLRGKFRGDLRQGTRFFLGILRSHPTSYFSLSMYFVLKLLQKFDRLIR